MSNYGNATPATSCPKQVTHQEAIGDALHRLDSAADRLQDIVAILLSGQSNPKPPSAGVAGIPPPLVEFLVHAPDSINAAADRIHNIADLLRDNLRLS